MSGEKAEFELPEDITALLELADEAVNAIKTRWPEEYERNKLPEEVEGALQNLGAFGGLVNYGLSDYIPKLREVLVSPPVVEALEYLRKMERADKE